MECACCMMIERTPMVYWCGNEKCSYYMCFHCAEASSSISPLCPSCRREAKYTPYNPPRECQRGLLLFFGVMFWCFGYVAAAMVGNVFRTGPLLMRVLAHFAHGCTGCVYTIVFVVVGSMVVHPGTWRNLLE